MNTQTNINPLPVVNYCSQICGGGQCGTSTVCHLGVVVKTHQLLNDGYAETIIDDPALYDAVEIHGVRNINAPGDNGTRFEVDNENPEHFSVYAHLVEGGAECVGDFGTHELASAYAIQIAKTYQYPIYNYTGFSHE